MAADIIAQRDYRRFAAPGLRVEEAHILEGFGARTLAASNLNRRDSILLAVRAKNEWEFNPAHEFDVGPGNSLVVMTTPEGRKSLEKSLGGAA